MTAIDIEGDDYDGRVFVAVNTNYTAEQGTGAGYRTEADSRTVQQAQLQDSVYSDEGMTMVYAQLPEVPVDVMLGMLADAELQAATYTTASTKTITDDKNNTFSMQCLYIGTHCTVWGETNCDNSIKINSTIAKEIADKFDGLYDSFGSYFGTEAKDVDSDGKIAIFCHDIDKSYGAFSGGSYTGGYFWSADFTNGNNVDCIHIDTYL